MTIRQDLHILQGATWAFSYTHSEDLTGYSARMSIKRDFQSGALAYLSTGSDADGGSIAISTATITLSMTPAQTDEIINNDIFPLPPHEADPVERYEPLIYDLEIVSPAGAVTRLLSGKCTVERGVTR